MNVFFTLIYDCLIFCYVKSISIAAWFNPKARLWVKGRKDIFNLIKSTLKPSEERVWFHCASLGEFEQCRPVLERYRELFPRHKIVLTFFSPSGYEIRKDYDKADYIFYLPYDSRQNAQHFITLVNPKLAIFVKYEFWWHYLYELHNKNIYSVLISATFREDQFFFTPWGKPFSAILDLYNQIFVQDKTSLQVLISNKVGNAQVAPDTRFDRVLSIAKDLSPLPILDAFCKNVPVFIAGSTWHDDEKILAHFFQNSLAPGKIKLIIAPHEINAKHIELLLQQLPNALLYSNANVLNVSPQVLIIDRIGLLSQIYRYGRWAYVGGGFGDGIHNTLEPSVYGLPVFFGPNWQKFNEAKKLLESGGAFCIKNVDELIQSFDPVKNSNGNTYLAVSESNKKFVRDNGGGTEKIIDYLEKLYQ